MISWGSSEARMKRIHVNNQNTNLVCLLLWRPTDTWINNDDGGDGNTVDANATSKIRLSEA